MLNKKDILSSCFILPTPDAFLLPSMMQKLKSKLEFIEIEIVDVHILEPYQL